MGPVVSNSLLIETDVTMADESILTENADRAIQGIVAIQVTQPRG